MVTIKASVEELIDGDIIVEQIFSGNTIISLVVAGTVVNQKIKDKLSNAGVDEIVITRSKSKQEGIKSVVESAKDTHKRKKGIFKEEYRSKVSNFKDIFKNVLNGEKVDLEKVSKVSDDIFKNVDDIYVAIESINELKDFDEYTHIHSINVALYSMLLANWMNLEKEDIKDLVKASVLHDIGKAKIPDNILNKPGKFTDEESIEMRNHAQYSYDICEDIEDVSDRVKQAVLSHHEKIDGSGYPNGLKGDEICLFSKIIAVCDVYDAITSKRVYKDKITPFETFEEIIEHGYGKLDTEIMLTFLDNIGNLYIGLDVKLSNGEIGEIVFIPHDKLSQPLIKVDDKFIDLSVEKDIKIKEIV